MMKKVLYGVALALLASVSVGSLQSCKDDVNDLATQTSYDLSKLRQQLSDESKRLEKLIGDNTEAINAEVAARRADIATVNGLIEELQQKDRDQQTLIDNIDGALSQLKGRVDQLEGNVYSKDYIDGQLLAINNELTALKEFAESMPAQLEEIYMAIEQTQEFLTQALNAHAADIEDLQGQVDILQEAIDTIIAKLDKQVTGILIQGVYSPVFGDFRTPLGVKSNILFNWYGYNERNLPVEFPSNDFNVNGKPGLDLAALAPAGKFTAPQGYYADDETGNVTLGKVYVTLNPVGAQFDNLEVTIENSKGDPLPYPVTLTPSNYVLQHGYTRTAENGFYEGEVKMPLNEDNVNDIVVALEEDLKVAMKDVVKDPSKTTAKALVKAVLEQLQGKIPAYGLRYGWYNGSSDETDPGFTVGNYAAVLSQYDLAVATALPLGYNFAKGYEGSAKLPEIGHIENLINKIKENGALKFELTDITVGDITLNWDEIKFDATGNGQLKITIPNVMIGDDLETAEPVTLILTTDKTVVAKEGEKVSYIEGLDDIKSGIVDGIKSGVQDVTGQLTNEIKTQLDNVIEEINKQLGGQIDKMFDGILEPFEPYFGKIDKAIDIYNKIANKINNFLKDPNAYLQVAAFYSMGGSSDYGIASGKKNDPTPFYSNGGDSFNLFLSSYTGELIVPACKKYVAVTGVYNKKGEAVANADLAALNTGDLNKVLSGNRIKVLVKGLPAGNVYEFTYQALDYRGYTSTKKFYIEVK